MCERSEWPNSHTYIYIYSNVEQQATPHPPCCSSNPSRAAARATATGARIAVTRDPAVWFRPCHLQPAMVSFPPQAGYLKNPDLYARIAAPMLTGEPAKDPATGKWTWDLSSAARTERESRTRGGGGKATAPVNRGGQRKGSIVFHRRFSGAMMDARVRETMRMQRATTEYIKDERREMMLMAAAHAEEEARARAVAEVAAEAARVAREEAERVAAEAAAEEQRKLRWEQTKTFKYSPARIPNFVQKVKAKAAARAAAPETHRRGISEFDTSQFMPAQQSPFYGVPEFAEPPPPPPPPPPPASRQYHHQQQQQYQQPQQNHIQTGNHVRHNKRASAHLISDSALARINRF